MVLNFWRKEPKELRKSYVFKGFAEGIRALNFEKNSEGLMLVPGGRAYRTEDGFHMERVHVPALMEDFIAHSQIQRDFRNGNYSENISGGVYAGAAGFVNLGFIAAARPGAAVMYDINPLQTMYWEMLFDMMAACPELEDFKKFVEMSPKAMAEKCKLMFGEDRTLYSRWFREKKIEEDTIIRGCGNMKKWLNKSFFGYRSPDRAWLTEENYRHLHLMAKNKALGAITLDVCDDEAFARFKDYLDNAEYTPICDDEVLPAGRGAKVTCLYISNLFNFLTGSSDWTKRELSGSTQDKAIRNFETVLDQDNRLIINCTGGAGKHFHEFGLG